MDNITWGPDDSPMSHRNQNSPDDGQKTPGDTDAPDIVGRTGEEMPEVAHDTVDGDHPDDNWTDKSSR